MRLLFLTIITFVILRYVSDNVVPEPYMDEIFHVPQAITYWKGRFGEWNDKITTPPGLYYMSLPFIHLSSYLTNHLSNHLLYFTYKPVFVLRSVNACFGLGIFLVSRGIARKQGCKVWDSWIATNVYLFPVSFFFHHLYYTDSGSTFFVLLGYLMALDGRCLSSAFVSSLALLFRQTNVVWLLFNAGVGLVSHIKIRRKTLKSIGDGNFHLGQEIISLVKICFYEMPGTVVKCFLPSISIVALSAWYLQKYNEGSIVFGDKSNHVSSAHIPQIFYFACFSVFFLSPWLLLGRIWGGWRGWIFSVKSLLLLLFSLLAVFYFTHEHPFLLADNRHYTFYIWKWIFRRHFLVKYAVTPIYVICMMLLLRLVQLFSTVPFPLSFGLFACTVAVLVPSPLLEFRYFMVPFILLRLSFGHRPGTQQRIKKILIIETVFYSIINVTTFYLFIAKPFKWPGDEKAIQRFMW